MKTFYIKRGETFKVTISLKDSDNLPINLPVENISSQLRDSSGNLIDNFVIVKSETIGDYLFSLVDTSNYPIENLSFDIKIKNQSNEIVFSQTMSLSVLQSQTENPEEISLQTLKVEVNLLTERLNELEPKVETSQSIQTINSDITSLESRVSSLENGENLSQLTSDVNSLKLSVQALETNFTDQEIENMVNSVFQPQLND